MKAAHPFNEPASGNWYYYQFLCIDRFFAIAFVFREDKISSIKKLSSIYTAGAALYAIIVMLDQEFLRVPFLFAYDIAPAGTMLLFVFLLLPLFLALATPKDTTITGKRK